MNTSVQFADEKALIIHHNEKFTPEELAAFKRLTSGEFKKLCENAGFKEIAMKDNPFL